MNVIRSLVRRKAMSADAGRTAVDILDRMHPVLHDPLLPLPGLFDLANRYELTAYVSSVLRWRLNRLPIAGGDSGLLAALSRVGVKRA